MTRRQAGNYTCHASNVEGDAESKPVSLTIMCEYYSHTTVFQTFRASVCSYIIYMVLQIFIDFVKGISRIPENDHQNLFLT